jgi:hypothetical protein
MTTIQYAKSLAVKQLIHGGWIPALAQWAVDATVEQHPNRPDAYRALMLMYVNSFS